MVGREEAVDGVQQCHPRYILHRIGKSSSKKNRNSPLIKNIAAASITVQASERLLSLQKFTLFVAVILAAEMGYQLFAHHVPERVLKLFELDEKVMLRIQAGCRL